MIMEQHRLNHLSILLWFEYDHVTNAIKIYSFTDFLFVLLWLVLGRVVLWLRSCYMHPAILLGHPANSEWTILPFCEGCFRKTSLRKTSGKTFFRKKNVRFRKNSRICSGRTCSGIFPKEGSSGRPPSSSGRRFFHKLFCFLFFKCCIFLII